MDPNIQPGLLGHDIPSIQYIQISPSICGYSILVGLITIIPFPNRHPQETNGGDLHLFGTIQSDCEYSLTLGDGI